jgi:hypothetical protein
MKLEGIIKKALKLEGIITLYVEQVLKNLVQNLTNNSAMPIKVA